MANQISLTVSLAAVGIIKIATVAIGGGVNAALLAAEILALSDEELSKKLDKKRESGKNAVLAKDKSIEERLRG